MTQEEFVRNKYMLDMYRPSPCPHHEHPSLAPLCVYCAHGARCLDPSQCYLCSKPPRYSNAPPLNSFTSSLEQPPNEPERELHRWPLWTSIPTVQPNSVPEMPATSPRPIAEEWKPSEQQRYQPDGIQTSDEDWEFVWMEDSDVEQVYTPRTDEQLFTAGEDMLEPALGRLTKQPTTDDTKVQLDQSSFDELEWRLNHELERILNQVTEQARIDDTVDATYEEAGHGISKRVPRFTPNLQQLFKRELAMLQLYMRRLAMLSASIERVTRRVEWVIWAMSDLRNRKME